MSLSDRVAQLESRTDAMWNLLGEMIEEMTRPSTHALLAALENEVVNNLLNQCNSWLRYYQELAAQAQDNEKATKNAKPPLGAIPTTLDTPEFRAAWILWVEDRKRRRKTITPHGADLQLRKLAAVGVTRAIEVIELAIEKGWTGLVFDQGGVNGAGQRSPVRSDSRVQFDANRNGQKPVIVCGSTPPAAGVPKLPPEQASGNISGR